MHRDFRRRLDNARGVSEFPIVLNVDIREFTKWSGDSAEAGLFIKKTYIRLIDEYFEAASFYKATGDGLLVVFPVDETDPQAAVRSTVDLALKIVEDFPTLSKGDPMINFPTPKAVGVGLARGPASRLLSGRKTLDYSGTTLNIASRLMDLARPQGVVLDEAFGHELLTPTVAERFAGERVYLAGVAPTDGRDAFYTTEWTKLPPSAKKPLDAKNWGGGVLTTTRKNMEELTGSFLLRLDSTPQDPSQMVCYIKHDAPTKGGRRKRGGDWVRLDLDPNHYQYRETPGGPVLAVSMNGVRDLLAELGAGPTWDVELRAEFLST